MTLKEKVKNLPSSPGVYLMKDSLGMVIYVGKAKNLKNRVRTYFQNSKAHPQKIKKLKANIHDFEIICLDTEFEAFMLECQLIKKLQPLFNRKMKNSQSYTYIMFQMDGRLPKISITQRREEDINLYFGPFTSRHTVEKAVVGIMDFYKINCSNPTFTNTPCLNYSLGLCIGTCFSEAAVQQYEGIINKIIALLAGTDTFLLEEMTQKMEAASFNFEFEIAAKYRDILEAIHSLIHKERVIEFTEDNKNIVILEPLDDNTFKLFLIKGNKVLFMEKFAMESLRIDPLVEVMTSTILSHFSASLDSIIEVNRDNLDQTQIIYSYLNGSNCDSFLIPDQWIENKDSSNIAAILARTLPTIGEVQSTGSEHSAFR